MSELPRHAFFGLVTALFVASCATGASDGTGGNAGTRGTGGMNGTGGGGGLDLGIDDPSDSFDIYDPQEGEEGRDLPPGTETALPPDDEIRSTFAALEASGGEPYLYYDRGDQGEAFNVRMTIEAEDIVHDLSGGQHIDIDLGAITVRVANTADSTTTLPTLIVPRSDLSDVVIVKSYSREGGQGPVSLDFVSAFDRDDQSAGPVESLDISNHPDVNLASDCEAQAWEIASEVPPIAVDFPPLDGCLMSECPIVKAAWIRAVHDVWRIRQMLEYIDTKSQARREFLWGARAADNEGNEATAATSLEFYFGGFAQYRFEAIRWAFKRLRDDMKDHNIGGLALDLECRPTASGDICNTAKPPAHHAVKSNIKICGGFFQQDESYQPLLLVHEPLHHVFVPWNDNGPRLSPIMDTHTHAHGDFCVSSITTNKAYGLDEVRHLATYKAGDGGNCFHRNFAFRNNDTYGWVALIIGSGVRQGGIQYWPFTPLPDSPQFNPCDGSDFPDPGDGWHDPLNDCMKVGMELVCPMSPGGHQMPDLDIALDCP